ncbi:hypothetical protein EV213_10525 [Aureibacillus halotolerans]|uniref:Uncharacterized protein n=1 Tax=Aureibacillus halotolerans TaxID=1508390 RepID=A0A4R6UC86_9BACI|nr:hypothetical protein EV213_10525 [Aureibacillus halotolerans]
MYMPNYQLICRKTAKMNEINVLNIVDIENNRHIMITKIITKITKNE